MKIKIILRKVKGIDKISIPFSDLGRTQTCNLLSRNQMHYSVMLRGLISVKYQIVQQKNKHCIQLCIQRHNDYAYFYANLLHLYV